VVSGFTRTRAVQLINTDPELRTRAGLKDGEVYPLLAIVANINEEESLIANIVENSQRNATSPIDDAHNHERLRTLGWKDHKIAELYQRSLSSILWLQRLLTLERKYQEMVHRGEMSVTAAVDLLDLPPEQRATAMATVEPGANKREITQRVRDAKREGGVVTKRSIGEVRKFLAGATGDEVQYDNPHTRSVLGAFYRYVQGETNEDVLLDELATILK
jgi:ParB-like chromosome segregation protein Spo0J